MDWFFLTAVITAIAGAIIGAVASELLRGLREAREQKKAIRIAIRFGCFLEIGKKTSVYALIIADNSGMKDTSIKRILATAPAEGGVTALSVGELREPQALPIDLGAGKSKLLDVSFNLKRPRFLTLEKNQTMPAEFESWFTGRRLPVRVVIEHTHGRAQTDFDAYSCTSRETILIGSLSQLFHDAKLAGEAR